MTEPQPIDPEQSQGTAGEPQTLSPAGAGQESGTETNPSTGATEPRKDGGK